MVADPLRPDPMFAVVGRNQKQRNRWIKVHIIEPEKPPTTEWVIPLSWGGATYCGRDIWKHRGGGQVDEFHDEALCVQCYRAWQSKGFDIDLLFEHEVPEEPWLS